MPCDLTLRSGSSISSLLTLREASLPPVCGLKVLFSWWVSDTTANLRLVQNISYKSTWIYQYFHFRDTFHHFKSYYIKHVHSSLVKSQRWVKPFSLKWKITYLYVKKVKNCWLAVSVTVAIVLQCENWNWSLLMVAQLQNYCWLYKYGGWDVSNLCFL